MTQGQLQRKDADGVLASFRNDYHPRIAVTVDMIATGLVTAAASGITREDFDYAMLVDQGGLQKAWGLLGQELDGLKGEMNEELVA